MKQFRRAAKRLGFEYRQVNSLPNGVSARTDMFNKVVYVTPQTNPASLFDEYLHMWNDLHGRGKHLVGQSADRHRFLDLEARQVESTSDLAFATNLEFHQLEMLNFFRSGATIPEFASGVTEQSVRVFTSLSSKI